jgi:hypothetical protein
MALTGYYKTLIRPRTHRPLSMLKYDPVGTSPSIFVLQFSLPFRVVWLVVLYMANFVIGSCARLQRPGSLSNVDDGLMA